MLYQLYRHYNVGFSIRSVSPFLNKITEKFFPRLNFVGYTKMVKKYLFISVIFDNISINTRSIHEVKIIVF